MSAYCASKAALDHLAACLMLEVRPQGVKVTTIAPGSVDTSFAGSPRGPDTSWMLTAEDVAAAVARPPPRPRRRPPLPGRDAARPTPEARLIRKAGRVAWRAFLRFQQHGGPDRAAAVAFYTLLSILPLFIFVIWLGAWFLGSFDRAYEGSLLLFQGVVVHLDAKTLESLRAFVERAGRFPWPALVLFAWTARGIFVSLFSALETIFERPSRRGFLKGNLLAFGLVIFLGIAQLATMVLTATFATTEGLLLRAATPEDRVMVQAVASRLFDRGLPVAITFAFLFLLYWVAPRRVTTMRHAAFGALLATALWEVAKAGLLLLRPQPRALRRRLRRARGSDRARPLAGALRRHRSLLRRDRGPGHPRSGSRQLLEGRWLCHPAGPRAKIKRNRMDLPRPRPRIPSRVEGRDP